TGIRTMRRVTIGELRTGDRLGRDIYGGPDALALLRAGVRVSDSYRQSLQRAGITSVWIDDGISEGIEPIEMLEETTKRRATTADILGKAGRLTDEGWKSIRTHTLHGFQMLKKAEGISPLSRAVVRSHHEKWAGGGYPDNHSGSDIHQFARIAAVADVFDA